MSKRQLRYYSIRGRGQGSRGALLRQIIFIIFLLTAVCGLASCARRVITPALPRYEETLSFDEIVTEVSDDVQVLKAVAEIRIEKNGEPIEQVNASVIIQRPDRAHMRIYKFGMLTGDIVMQDGKLYGPAGKGNSKLAGLIDEFFHAVFWWDNLKDASLRIEEDEYIIRAANQEIHLDRATLLPIKQDLKSYDRTVHITYSEPQSYDGFWYPSKLDITVEEFRFAVKIERLIKNPSPGEGDFRVP